MYKKRIINQLIKIAASDIASTDASIDTQDPEDYGSAPNPYISAVPTAVDLGRAGMDLLSKYAPSLSAASNSVGTLLGRAAPYAGAFGGSFGSLMGAQQLNNGIQNKNIEDIGLGAINTGAGAGALLGSAGALADPALVPRGVGPLAQILGTFGLSTVGSNALTHAFGVPYADSRLDDNVRSLAKPDGSYDADNTYNSMQWNASNMLNHVGNQIRGIATAPKRIYDYVTSPEVASKQERRAQRQKDRQAQADYEYSKMHGLTDEQQRAAAKAQKNFYENPAAQNAVFQQIPSSNIYPNAR